MRLRGIFAWLAPAFALACGGSSGPSDASSRVEDGGMTREAQPDGPALLGSGSDASTADATTTDATGSDAMGADAVDGDSAAGDSAGDAAEEGDAGGSSAISGWTLTWSDEFEGPDGSAVDPTRWVHDVGGTGWGNNELEYYTDGTQNAVVTGGNLVITATTAGASAYTCSYPANGPCEYTSARLLTQNKFSQEYGLFEARIQIPEGQGLWPAFWMLGANIATSPWPACGEIDIMENIGSEPTLNHGSLHAPGFPGAGLTGAYTLPSGNLGDAFHTYAVQWEPTAIRFYVDDQLYETQTPSDAPAGGTWEFDHAFFLLLNVAVGGSYPGAPDSTTVFPQTMKVDWVRVYEPANGDP
jgi:beta-glucanase (GH16 family)